MGSTLAAVEENKRGYKRGYRHQHLPKLNQRLQLSFWEKKKKEKKEKEAIVSALGCWRGRVEPPSCLIQHSLF